MNPSPKTNNSGFAGKPDAKATLNLFNKINAMATQTDPTKSPKMMHTTPTLKRTRNKFISKSPSQKNTLWSSGWLSKKTSTKENREVQETKEENLKEKYCNKPKQKKEPEIVWIKNKTSEKSRKAGNNSKKTIKSKPKIKTIDLLDDFCNKPNKSTKSKHKFERFDSGGSLSDPDLPSFKCLKPKKPPAKRSRKENEGMRKYGVYVPTFDDIINDRKNYEEYKAQVETAQTLKEPNVSISFSPLKNNNRFEQEWLDCKHLSEEEVTRYFKKNIGYLEDIRSGKKYSERHQRYHDKINQVANKLTTKDLTYNTSMIVFTFEQIDKMLELLKEQFDPSDLLSDYFFKVLVPELCLKIFMDCHGLDEAEAVEYLDDRPVE